VRPCALRRTAFASCSKSPNAARNVTSPLVGSRQSLHTHAHINITYINIYIYTIRSCVVLLKKRDMLFLLYFIMKLFTYALNKQTKNLKLYIIRVYMEINLENAFKTCSNTRKHKSSGGKKKKSYEKLHRLTYTQHTAPVYTPLRYCHQYYSIVYALSAIRLDFVTFV